MDDDTVIGIFKNYPVSFFGLDKFDHIVDECLGDMFPGEFVYLKIESLFAEI